ncbi:CPBP family intramembrane glutamic endopeptidase [Feifania hominis]|uniref:CPBP family intramembrane metalloprotease n=1 Tax=Feifania hominis TaxID=2763660 RepID=A0A926DDS5_9FIRM|nr:CPBP family intramembrane glutamic endopeptidase [Feifania hominis]MBC8536341.1 CPBP family intramembrane metalloprotease [Feifania hominis]
MDDRRLLRRISGHTARMLLCNIALQFLLTFLLEGLVMLALALPDILALPDVSLSAVWALMLDAGGRSVLLTTGAGYVLVALIMLCANLLPTLRCAKKLSLTPRALFGESVPTARRTGWYVALALGLNTFGILIYNLLNTLLSAFRVEAEGSAASLPADSLWGAVAYVLFACLIAPVTEELIFRGVVLHALKPYGGLFAALASSLLFALIHGNFEQIPLTFMIGMLLSYVTLQTGNIRLAVRLHFINNAYAVATEILMLALPEQFLLFGGLLGYLNLGLMVFALWTLIARRREIHFESLAPRTAQVERPGRSYFTTFSMLLYFLVVAALIALTFRTF